MAAPGATAPAGTAGSTDTVDVLVSGGGVAGLAAAAAFGAILYTVVTGDNIVSALTGIIGKALNTSVG